MARHSIFSLTGILWTTAQMVTLLVAFYFARHDSQLLAGLFGGSAIGLGYMEGSTQTDDEDTSEDGK